MISISILLILSLISTYYFFKLRKIDKEKSEGISSIIVFSTVLLVIPMDHRIKGIIFIIILILEIFLYKLTLAKIETGNKEDCIKKEKNTLE